MQPEDLDFNHILADPAQYARDLTIPELEEHLMLFKNYYYNTDTPLVPDHVYDEMEDILRERSPQSKVLQTVGAQLLPSQRKTKLPFPMASQDKAKAQSGDLEKWLKKTPNNQYLVSDKLDGISLMYHYRRGKPAKLYTRGTTFEGQDVSHLLKNGLQMADTPSNRLKIPRDREEVAIRGELIMPKATWEEYYANNYPNVRNWIAGQVAHKTSQGEHVSRIRFVAYQMVVPDNILPIDQFEIMKNWGFYTSPAKAYPQDEMTEAQMIKHLQESKTDNPYQIDGLVITANKVFSPTDENPKDSIAFKSQIGEEVQVTVTKVEWNVSKRGYLKPIVHIEPVFLSGAQISKASGNNAKFIVDNVIGPGAVVEIIRSGEVIPYIMEVIEPAKSGKPDLPEELDYEWSPNRVDFIIKQETQQMTEKRLLHFAKTLQIDHLGPGTIKKIYEYTDVREPIDILELTLTELEEIPSLGKNAEKIYNSLQNVIKHRGVGLAQLIDALGVFGTTGGIGTRRIQSVLDVIPNLLEEIPKLDFKDRLLQVEGIKEKTAEPMAQGLKMFMNQIYPKLPKELIITDFRDDNDEESEEDPQSINSQMKGMRFIFTGVRASPEVQSLIKKSGGTLADTVLKTNPDQIVIAKDPSGSSGKLKKAREMGLKILSMDQFKSQFNIQD